MSDDKKIRGDLYIDNGIYQTDYKYNVSKVEDKIVNNKTTTTLNVGDERLPTKINGEKLSINTKKIILNRYNSVIIGTEDPTTASLNNTLKPEEGQIYFRLMSS